MYSTNDIRLLWLEFFKKKGHYILEPKSLIPINDPSLLWINSGVATLKDFFSGKANPPANRLTNCQKSIRTNDIQNVGVTSRHHTFFEMLGNFSIGDYFRKEAIEYAFEFLTDVLKFGLDKIYITVFEEDEEALNTWLKLGIDQKHIIKCDRSRNFWDLGEGPCGPCTEIYYDRGQKFDPKNIGEKLFFEDIENDRYVEIWNIVFSQYNNDGNGNYTELVRKNIDTGAGLERLAAILQDVPTNYDTSTFSKVYKLIENHTVVKYESDAYFGQDEVQREINRNFVVLVDHIKANIFAIADGALPGNKDRGSVLRKLIRRALLSAKKLNLSGDYISTIVNGIAEVQKPFYPYLKDNKDKIINVLNHEIDLFEKTLDNGLKIFNEGIKNNSLNGETTFKLVETYGFPLEVILDLAQEKNIVVDEEEFENHFKKHQQISRGNGITIKAMTVQKENLINFMDESEFLYDKCVVKNAKVIAIFETDFNRVQETNLNNWLVFDKTPFYATSGGQSCDEGVLIHNGNKFFVSNVQKAPNHQHLHYLASSQGIKLGDTVDLEIDQIKRLDCTRNHSAEHLLHKALTQVIDKNIKQEGASKTAEKLTFDFQNPVKLSEQQLQSVEDKVNEYITKSENVETIFATLDEAKALGAFAYFEDVYAKINTKLRVVKMGETSTELCGGTHVKNVGEIEQFLITKCSQKGSGSFRIEAITGRKKINEYVSELISKLKQRVEKINNSIKQSKSKNAGQIGTKIKSIGWENFKIAEKQVIEIEKDFAEFIKLYDQEKKQNTINMIIDQFEKNISKNNNFLLLINCEPKAISEALGKLADKHNDSCFVCVNTLGPKTQYFISTKSETKSADEIIKKINVAIGGFGSGRKNFAQGGAAKTNIADKIRKIVQRL